MDLVLSIKCSTNISLVSLHAFFAVSPEYLSSHLDRIFHQIYGDKDTDGFYRGEVRGRMGLIPCNMVSEIRAEDDETMDQLIKQGFLPLSTPVDRLGTKRQMNVIPPMTKCWMT